MRWNKEKQAAYWVLQLGARWPGPTPGPGLDRGLAEMRGRVHLWNELVAIERTWQQSVREALAEVAPDLLGAARALVDATDPAARKSVWIAYKAARDSAWRDERVKARLATCEQARLADEKLAVSRSGLYWCNSDAVQAAFRNHRGSLSPWVLADAQSPRGTRDLKRGRFHAWRDERATVSVRFQCGLPVADLWGRDSRLQIDPVPTDAWTHPVRGERRRAQRTMLRIRVGSDGRRRAPVWLELPVVLHRPLPDGGLIRSAAAFCERIGTQARWSAVLVVQLPTPKPVAVEREPVIGLDIGWRRVPAGLRVATWEGSDGGAGELVLSERWLRGMLRAEDIGSVRQNQFNAVLAHLANWLREYRDDVPSWLREATRSLGQWRSPARLAALTLRWREQRWPGDADAFGLVESWRQRDKHLLLYEANLRDRLQAQRRAVYCQFAHDLAERAGAVRLKQLNLAEMALHGDDDTRFAESSHRRKLASLSQLCAALAHACSNAGVPLTKVASAYSTQTCSVCGRVEEFDSGAAVVHTCSNCGATWDQDYNAARWMMVGGVPSQDGSSPPATAGFAVAAADG